MALKSLNANSGTRNDEEHQRECHQQDFERQFVRRLLAGSRFHHGDHLVQEAGTRIGGNPHHQPVRKHGSASGNGGAVAASLADDRGRLARDGAFVHRRGTHDDLSVCGNLLFRPHEEQVLLLQGDRVHLFGLSEEEAGWVVHMTPLCHQALVRARARPRRAWRRAGRRPGPCPGFLGEQPSAKFANRTVHHRMTLMASVKPEGVSEMPKSDRTKSPSVSIADTYTISMTGFFACSRGASFLNASATARAACWRVAACSIVVIFLSPDLLQHHHQVLRPRYPAQAPGTS